MSEPELKAASYVGPVATTTALGGIYRGVNRYATATTNQSAALPTATDTDGKTSSLVGKFVDIKNESQVSALDFAFGLGSAPTLVYGQAAAFGTGHVSAGWNLNPGETKSVIVPAGATHIAHIQPSGATASTIAIYVSEAAVPVR